MKTPPQNPNSQAHRRGRGEAQHRLEPAQMAHHIEWLRQLARSLVRDPGLADDLVQETALAALEAPPALAEGGPRAWLGRVLRNRLGDEKRQSRSRTEREVRRDQEGSQGRSTSSASDDLVSQIETERMLSEELLRLEEPMRETLMLRFYEGLPPRRIAQRQGIPVATVKSRLARGLTHMRRNLDARHDGDRRLWMAAVLPMAKKAGAALGAGTSASVLTIGGIAMNVKLVAAFTLTAVLSGTLLLLASPSAKPDPAAEKSDLEVAAESAGDVREPGAIAYGERPDAPEPTVGRQSAEVAASEPAPLGGPPPAPPTYTFTGTVLDADARAVTGVPITLEGEEERSKSREDLPRSGAGGRFTFTTLESAGTLVAATADDGAGSAALASPKANADRWVTVRPGTYRVGPSRADTGGDLTTEPLVIVARAIDLEGIVVDDWGAPIAGLQVILDLPQDFVSRFDQSQSKSVRKDWRATTGDDGRFVLAGVPSVGGASIEAATGDGRSARIDAPATNASDLRLVIAAPPIPIERRLTGVVLRADGSAASEARVSMGAEMVRTADDGSFEIDLR
ncbi:MAG: RNA polymerase sigma factor, partial [Planctomycetota bacterium]